MSHTFCADLSREQDDPLAGSAAHAERNLLISWPRSKWLRSMRHASDMDGALKQALNAIADSGRRVNLIQQPSMDKHQHQVFLMPERRRFQVMRHQLENFLSALQTDSSLAAWEQPSLETDLLLCCTHGKKDKCCAKYGYQTYKALAQAVADHCLPFEVWESSHLGGCRLAASLILLPNVRKYGRVTPAQALPFLQTEANGQRYLPSYRGNSQFTPAQQCAELAALTHLSTDQHQPQLTLLDDSGSEQERLIRWQWQRGNAQGQLSMRCQATTIMRVDTCADLEQGPTERNVWRIIQPRAGD
ncbi:MULTISPECIES: sucrase ferredoxin [unclassified Halomonas]|uniref:sucrase ferredoxin n=1 Tax=unclassified Halomonas TaxID=2609666 RepID=UPI00099053CC|nr:MULTISPECIES: sucrase ferredoxin [unclassified Halomonas]AQU81537.1 sucrase ferredoxin [Halomonas sp. 'Soap Lake \